MGRWCSTRSASWRRIRRSGSCDLLDGLEGTRLVATTHLDLRALAERGAFSEALLDALTGTEVLVPALRERAEDIVPLAEIFAAEAGAEPPVRFSPGALARLRSHSWPGNVLELRNAMERAVRLSPRRRDHGRAPAE